MCVCVSICVCVSECVCVCVCVCHDPLPAWPIGVRHICYSPLVTSDCAHGGTPGLRSGHHNHSALGGCWLCVVDGQKTYSLQLQFNFFSDKHRIVDTLVFVRACIFNYLAAHLPRALLDFCVILLLFDHLEHCCSLGPLGFLHVPLVPPSSGSLPWCPWPCDHCLPWHSHRPYTLSFSLASLVTSLRDCHEHHSSVLSQRLLAPNFPFRPFLRPHVFAFHRRQLQQRHTGYSHRIPTAMPTNATVSTRPDSCRREYASSCICPVTQATDQRLADTVTRVALGTTTGPGCPLSAYARPLCNSLRSSAGKSMHCPVALRVSAHIGIASPSKSTSDKGTQGPIHVHCIRLTCCACSRPCHSRRLSQARSCVQGPIFATWPAGHSVCHHPYRPRGH